MPAVFCYASGHVGFGECPKGAIPLGIVKDVEAFSAHCRHAYDGHTLLIPGVPEAPNQSAGIDAVFKFCDRLRKVGILSLD